MVKQKIINKNNSLRYKFKVFTCVFLTGLFLKVPILQAATSAEIDAMRNDSLTWLIGSGLIGLIGAARRKARI